jgi:hypothetical protein
VKLNRVTAGMVAVFALTLTGCAETFTFEAVPVGVDEDDAELGVDTDPSTFECFEIEADSSSGSDDKDVQLGRFCKTDEAR